MSVDPRLSYLEKLPLRRATVTDAAGLMLCSLPVPPAAPTAYALAGVPAAAEPVGEWPNAANCPRRYLLTADAVDNQVPESVTLSPADGPCPPGPLPTAEMILLAKSPEDAVVWERHALRLQWGKAQLTIVMGMAVAGTINWWEGCRLTTVWTSPTCMVIEMGGVMPRHIFTLDDLNRWPSLDNPYLHRHNWLNGHLRARLHSNGVCEITARHINASYVDDGLDLADAVPVIGFKGANSCTDEAEIWDGSCQSLAIDGVRLAVAELSRLATPALPGRLFCDAGFRVLQPYAGVQVYGGACPQERTGQPWIFKVEDRAFPRGMSRVLRFSLSLNPARSPVIARYLPPAWWFGACEEFAAAPYLPVHNAYDKPLASAREWVQRYIVAGGFEDGALPRGTKTEADGRHEAGWEGELPGALFHLAWRSGEAADMAHALRAGDYFHDVAVDHAARAVRMHGYPPNAISLPATRIQACLQAWLERGDPFMLKTARQLIDTAYALHKNSWPRLAIGRDACFLRGAVLLYRYTGDEHYARIARDGIEDVIVSQRPDGSFGDQGGGAGIHGQGAYVTKPWMCCMAVGPILDYLELFPDDARCAAAVMRYGEWLMAERWEHANGVRGWSYKHAFNGRREQYSPREGGLLTFPSPGLWHLDYLARILPFCSELSGDCKFFDAFAESAAGRGDQRGGDHGVAQALQFLPWLQARLWRVELAADGVRARPTWYGTATPQTASIETPAGTVQARWSEDGSAVAFEPAGMITTSEVDGQ